MTMLITGIAVFFAAHLLSSARGTRGRLIQATGEKPYKAVFALLSLLGLVLIAWGKSRAAFEPLYEPPAFGHSLALALMPLAFMFLAASLMPTNLKRLTAHPMLWGITLWATLHLLANGDRASVMLFGSFLVYSIYAMASQTRRGAHPKGQAVAIGKDIIVIVAGMAVAVVIALAHGWLFGMPLKS